MVTKELLFSVTKKDLIIQTFRSGGKGGQHQNKTSSGVRIIHKDSGARGESREERSQLQNKRIAFKRMAETKEFKLWIRKRSAEILSISYEQKNKDKIAFGSKDTIRTYNYSRNSVKDHRTKLEIKNIKKVLNGHIGPFIEANKRMEE